MLLVSLVPASAGASIDQLQGITTPHLMLMEEETGTILYEKDAHSKAFPASTTKIMTCLVALENCSDVNAMYQCGWESQNGFGSQSSLLGLKNGYVVSIKDMLYGLMLCSGNDCGACLAVATAGSIERFVELMNDKAAEIGMTGTHYTNPHGLHDEQHYTTAYDMALLMQYGLKNDIFREIIATKEYTVVEANGKLTKTIQTSNKLLYTKQGVDWEDNIYQYAIGGKTGETNFAGYCLVEAAQKDGVTLIAVLLGDNNMGGTTTYYRFHNAKKLFEYGFSQYVDYDLAHYGVTNAFNVQTVGFDPNDPNNGRITATVDISSVRVAGNVDEISKISAGSFAWAEPVLDMDAVTAPIAEGDKLGTVTLELNGEPYFTGDLIAEGAMSAPGNSSGNKGGESSIVGGKGSQSRGISNLSVSKNGGDAEYTVWVFYKNTLFTMQDGLTLHYLFFDGEVFRSTKLKETPHEISLFKLTEDENGNRSFVYAQNPEAGCSYVVVSEGKALRAVKKSRSLAAADVIIDKNSVIKSDVTDDMIWSFNQNGSGYQLISNGLYLHRSGGSGLLFWILIGILVIALVIVIRIPAWIRNKKHNSKRRSKYKIYKR